MVGARETGPGPTVSASAGPLVPQIDSAPGFRSACAMDIDERKRQANPTRGSLTSVRLRAPSRSRL
jgi:hypothetical protein